MNETTPVLPVTYPWSRAFWEAARRHELVIQRCLDCGERIMYPKYFCPACMSKNLGWEKASGRGTLYSFSTVCLWPPSAFADATPYVVAIVRLEEGVQLLTNIVDCDPAKLSCDLPVEVVFDDVTPEVTLPKFRPVRSGTR